MAKKPNGKKTKRRGDGRIDPDILTKLTTECSALESEAAEIRGDMGARIKTAKDDHGLHAEVFRLVRRINNMEATKKSDFLRAFDSYRHILGLDNQSDMFDKKAAATEPAPAPVH